jgi:hypothetical protein
MKKKYDDQVSQYQKEWGKKVSSGQVKSRPVSDAYRKGYDSIDWSKKVEKK